MVLKYHKKEIFIIPNRNINKENLVEFVKKLDVVTNYGYIVQDSLYSQARPDSDDRFDYYDYQENCLISERYSFFKDLPSILIEMDCIIEDGHIHYGENFASSLFDITNLSLYKDSLFISYTITDEYKTNEDGSLEQEYHTFTIKKLNKDGSEAIQPLKIKWDNISYYEDIENLLED